MMLPPPRSRIAGATVFVKMNAPTRLMRRTSAKSAALISRRAARRRTAAQLTRQSTPPYCARAVPTNRATSASLATSPLTAVATPPALTMASTVSASGSGRLPKTTTRAPSWPKSSAVARPMPVPPPAMSATLPSSAGTVIAPAEGLHRTPRALGLARRAPRRAEIHQGLIVVIGASRGDERFGEVPHGLLAAEAGQPPGAHEDPAEHSPHVRVHEGGVLPMRESQDGPGRVPAYPAKAKQLRAPVGEPPAVARHRLAGDAVQVLRAAIVAERIPGARHVAGAGARELLEGRIATEELTILGDDAVDLRLLEHDLRDEDAIRIAGPAPRKVATVSGVPGEQAPVEASPRAESGGRHGGHCDRAPSPSQVDFAGKHVTMGPCRHHFPSTMLTRPKAPSSGRAPAGSCRSATAIRSRSTES